MIFTTKLIGLWRKKMILAIIERIEDIKERAPFNNRYYLTEYYKKIFDELLKKRNEGLDVKNIIDNNRVNKEKPSFTLEDHFEVYRVDVMSERYKNIMHRKFCVIDLEVAMHGTFNWTNAANFNKEH